MLLQPENAMLERAVAGDREALVSLLEQYGPRVRDVLSSRIPSRFRAVLSADDVMQETYVDAFLDIGRFEVRGPDSFVAWLTTLAERNLRDALRMLKARKRGGDRGRVELRTQSQSFVMPWDLLSASGVSPSGEAAGVEARGRLHEAVRQLPPRYRMVVELYDLEGRSIDEVAELLERSPGATYMVRARALRLLADIMGSPSLYMSGTG